MGCHWNEEGAPSRGLQSFTLLLTYVTGEQHVQPRLCAHTDIHICLDFFNVIGTMTVTILVKYIALLSR